MVLADGIAWATALAAFGSLGLEQYHLGKLPRLPDPGDPARLPSVCLCIPARNEALELRRALEGWLAQDYPGLRVLVVDDASTDDTPAILAELQKVRGDRLRVIRNDQLPPGWLGKNHALHLASSQPEARAAEWLLFADADTQADPDLLRRAFAFLEAHPADLLALIPGMDTAGFWERLCIPFLSAGFLLLVPPHQVPNPKHPAFVGIGAFTLLRREAYDGVGGHAAAPLEAIDDMALGRRVKRSGRTTRVALGGPCLHLRIYHGLGEILSGLRKNVAAHPLWWAMPLVAALFLGIYLSPLWLPFLGHPWMAFLIWLITPALVGDVHQRLSGLPMEARWAFWPLIAPVVALAVLGAVLDRARGVNRWRGRTVRI